MNLSNLKITEIIAIDRNIEISDGVHPKTEGYVKMAKMVRNYINFLGQ